MGGQSGGLETGASLYRLEVTVGKGSGVRILNSPVPPAFRESVRYAEQRPLFKFEATGRRPGPALSRIFVTVACHGQRP